MRSPQERGIAALSLLTVALVGIAGIVVGAGLVVGGVIDPLDDGVTGSSTDSSSTALLDCRGGDPIDVVFDGDEVFAVGQDVTGSWIAIRTPDNPTVLGWLPSSQLDPASDLTKLPEQPCSGLDGAIVLAADTTVTVTTQAPDTTVTVTTQAPDTTVTVTTQAPDTTVTVTTEQPGTTVTQPPDTQPPILLDPLVMPSVIFPERCPEPDVTEGSAFLTVENETNVTATLSWSYLSPYNEDGDNSGSLPVEVLVDPANILLIGAISGLPDPYPFGVSALEATIEFQWVVTDAAGNWNSVTAEATVGRCL